MLQQVAAAKREWQAVQPAHDHIKFALRPRDVLGADHQPAPPEVDVVCKPYRDRPRRDRRVDLALERVDSRDLRCDSRRPGAPHRGRWGPWQSSGSSCATAANALNLYSNTLSARVLDLRWPRPVLAVAGGAIGLALALPGSGNFNAFFANFLLLLDYWITPWLAIVLLDFYWFGRQRPEDFAAPGAWNVRGIVAYLAGIGASVPFMAASFFSGPLAAVFGGADLSYFVGFAVAAVAYASLEARAADAREPRHVEHGFGG